MPPISFSVMTWNVENLFTADHASGSGPRTNDVYQRKLAVLARTINAIAPDVLAVQEIGDEAAFADLQRRLGDRYPYTRLSRHPDVRGIRVGYISRFPLLQAQDFDIFPATALRDFPNGSGESILSMGRGALKVTVAIAPGLIVNVVNCHLKSKLITYAKGRRFPLDEDERARGTGLALGRRMAEAVALRVFLNQLMTYNDVPMVLMGDLNDAGNAVSTEVLLGPPDRSLSNRDKFDDIRLYLLDKYIPAERRFSRMYQKEQELIDHIMVSHELIFYLKQADSYVEPIASIDADVDSRRDATFPDHAPVFARFELPEDEAERHFSITYDREAERKQ
jgi:endonuclease/exonuclease/phosphatase family metal-dependent hydrolase